MASKKKQISDYNHLKQVAVVLHPEDIEKIKQIKEGFSRKHCIGDLTVSNILRYALRNLDPEALFKDQKR